MSNCKGCGKKIVWGIDENGKTIPLDPAPPIYMLACMTTRGQEVTRAPRNEYMVSHFSTCAKANDFSSSRQTNEQGR